MPPCGVRKNRIWVAILLRVIQAFGLTSDSRKALPPAVDDVSFEARAGRVTVLLGAPGAGKTTLLRLMLQLQPGRGHAYFRGRPLHRIAHPSREIGVLLGDVPGHPARTVRGHLRMLCAAVGVPARRADEVLEVVGLVGLRDERLGGLSRGMDRRLGLACALLADPHTLVLDDPARGLSGRENRWLYGMLRTRGPGRHGPDDHDRPQRGRSHRRPGRHPGPRHTRRGSGSRRLRPHPAAPQGRRPQSPRRASRHPAHQGGPSRTVLRRGDRGGRQPTLRVRQ